MRGWFHLAWPLAAALQIAGFYDLRHDDAYITFRYGQNLALGHGLTFNPGERVMGSTSPVHVLLSALAYALFGRDATPSVMSVLGCAAWALQGYALWLILAELRAQPLGRERAALICGSMLAGAAGSWQWVALETNIVFALGLLAIAAAQRGAWRSAALAVGFACLVRPDALILAGLLLVRGARALRGAVLRPALVFVAVVMPWIAFAQLYYGSALPRSLAVKLQRASLSEYGSHFAQQITHSITGADSALAHVVAAALTLYGARALVRASPLLGLFGLYGALHAVAYLVLRSVTGHDWHLYPTVFVAAVLALAGVFELVQQAGSAAGARWPRLLVLAAGTVLMLSYAARTTEGARSHASAYWTGARDIVYRAVAEQIRSRTPEGARFASVEVGTLAYYSGLRAFDIGMLVTNRKQRPSTPIRWVVLDDNYLGLAPPWPALGTAEGGAPEPFRAHLYAVPADRSYFEILHARLAYARRMNAGK